VAEHAGFRFSRITSAKRDFLFIFPTTE